MDDQAPNTMRQPASGAESARHGVLPRGASLTPAPHDGLLLLAALTGNGGLAEEWLRVEQAGSVRPASPGA